MDASTWQLLISLVSIIIIVFLFLHYSRNYAKQSKVSTDILYISGYAVMIIVGLVVIVCLNSYDHKSIMDYITFGSTLSSLIMSVVAIIFTITQGKDGREQLGKITQATEDLKKTAEQLVEFKAIASVLADSMADLDENVGRILNKSNDIDQKIENMNTRISERNISVPEKTGNNDNRDKVVSEFLECGSFTGTLSLLACCYCKENNNGKMNIDTLASKIGYCDSSYAYAYIVASSALGVVNVNKTDSVIKVDYVDEKVKTIGEKFVKDFILREDNKDMCDEFLEHYNNVRKMFGLDEMTIDALKK